MSKAVEIINRLEKLLPGNLYLVSYDLRGKEKNYDNFSKKLKRLNAKRILKSQYILN